jgi:hypothetical protein
MMPKKGKVRVIQQPEAIVEDRPLPANLDAERFVLHACITEGAYPEIATPLRPEDFSLEKHKGIFKCIGDLYRDGKHIDRATVAWELKDRGELESCDGIGYLVSLDDGMPHIVDLAPYVEILQEIGHQREGIKAAEHVKKLYESNLIEEADAYWQRFQEGRPAIGGKRITSVDDLESIFADSSPVEYLIEPELPAAAVVYLAGDSESGKSTLACAWARDLVTKGHAVLLLDRDKNPRKVVRERFERLGMSDHPRLRIWDAQQIQEAPQPDSTIVVEWVKRMQQETGRPALVIVDSLIGFLRERESENDSVHMRALFDRCKVLNRLGATVVLLHHVGKNGVARGSSDFRPAGDQGFMVNNWSPNGDRLLGKITLTIDKSRYGLTTALIYNYAGGRFLRDESHLAVSQNCTEHLTSLLRTNPGISTKSFYRLAAKQGIPEPRAAAFLSNGLMTKTIRREPGPHNTKRHFLVDDSQSSFEESENE